MLSTLYYGFHEITKLMAKYMRHFVYYRRYIDEKCILWNNYNVPDAWDNVVRDVNNFELLKWKVENKGRKVNVLDLTITINESGRIEARTCQKPMNLYSSTTADRTLGYPDTTDDRTRIFRDTA